jgi:hypothetical protein
MPQIAPQIEGRTIMLLSTTSRQRLGALAAACLLSVALPAAPAWAQKTKTKPAPAGEPTITSSVSVDIPTIDAVGSNVDDNTLRAIFSGALTEHAEALAGLTATSISIPEITINTTTTVDGEAHQSTVTLADLELSEIANGIAASIALATTTIDAGEDGIAEFGTMSAANLNIGGMLGIYGLVDGGGQTELQTIYTDLHFEGGTLEATDVSCTIGAVTSAEAKARPLNHSFAEIMSLADTLEAQGDDPSPEQLGQMVHIYADVLTAFQTAPAEFEGFECSGIDDEDRPITVAIGSMTVGGMVPGIYPAFSLNDLNVTVEGDGTFQVGNMTIKEMDLSGPLAAVAAAPAAIGQVWLTENARALIPAFAGFSVSDLVVDVPDPDVDGERIAATMGEFDLTLGAYQNGIPTALRTAATNIVVDLPEDTEDEQLRQLIDMGLTNIDSSFVIDAAWNEADNTIAINEISMSGADLAAFALAGTITNASEALFSLDEDEALEAAMGIAISHLKLDISDAGLADILLARVAADQGGSPEAMRPIYAGLAQGTVIGLLAGAAEAQKVGSALGEFIGGSARELTIEMTAKEKPGLGLADFLAAEEDPSILIGKVTIDATAR